MQLLLGIFTFLLACYLIIKGIKHNQYKKLEEQVDENDIEDDESEQSCADPLLEETVVATQVPEPMEPKKIKQDYIALTIMPKPDKTFPGRLLLATLKSNRLHLGKQDIFQYYEEDNPGNAPVFSVASVVEPGTFDLEKAAQQNHPGLVFFLLLTEDSDAPMHAFDRMLKSARIIAAALNGELHDDRHQALTGKSIAEYRARIEAFCEQTAEIA